VDEWKKYEFDQKEIFLAVAGNCLILLLVFILGVKVGKVFFSNDGLPSDKEVLSSIKPHKTKVTFPKTLMDGGKRYVTDVSVPKNLPIIPSPQPPLSVAAKPKAKEKRTSTKARKRKQKSANKSHKYSVQIGSFFRMKDAQKMAEKYKRIGFKAYVLKINLARTYYRVRIGRYKTKSEGYKMMKVFSRKYGIKALLIRL